MGSITGRWLDVDVVVSREIGARRVSVSLRDVSASRAVAVLAEATGLDIRLVDGTLVARPQG